jgi:hypothetical protein
LTPEQRAQRHHATFRPSFTLTDERVRRAHVAIPSSFFLDQLYEPLYGDLSRRLDVDDVLLDYNYQRLFRCLNIMKEQRLARRFPSYALELAEHLPVDEYAMALEFYLQMDGRCSPLAEFVPPCSLSVSRRSLLHEDVFVSRCSSVRIESILVQATTGTLRSIALSEGTLSILFSTPFHAYDDRVQ